MMPARLYRTLPLLGSQPVRPFHPYQPSDWGALQRYARVNLVDYLFQRRPYLQTIMNETCSANSAGSTFRVKAGWP